MEGANTTNYPSTLEQLAAVTFWIFFSITGVFSIMLIWAALSALFLSLILVEIWTIPRPLVIWVFSFLVFPWVLVLLRMFHKDGSLKTWPYIIIMLILGGCLVVITYFFFNTNSELLSIGSWLPATTADQL